MPGLLIKDLRSDLHRRLKAEARKHHRSMTRQAVAILEEALERESVPPLPAVRPWRGRFGLTDRFLQIAKRRGRP